MPFNSRLRLSIELTSGYRLFLRATSAAVFHHPTATRNLRKLYRPLFDEAARWEAQLNAAHDPQARKLQKQLLASWNERVDNTLDLLYSSATTAGLAHRLTRNISFLTHAYLKSRTPQSIAWDPQLPASSQLYSIKSRSDLTTKEKRDKERKMFDVSAFRSLGQVIRLAEGRAGISLGRLPPSHKDP